MLCFGHGGVMASTGEANSVLQAAAPDTALKRARQTTANDYNPYALPIAA